MNQFFTEAMRFTLTVSAVALCGITMLYRIFFDFPYGSPVCLLMTILASVPCIVCVLTAVRVHDMPVEKFNLLTPFLQLCLWTIATLAFLSFGYINQITVAGGDVNPAAFLDQKTSSRGGYQYLVDKRTRRQYVVSDETFRNHPFSTYELLAHIPSIVEIKEESTLLDIPNNGRETKKTVTLQNATVHIPFNKEKLVLFFTEHEYESVEGVIAMRLCRLARPITSSMRYPPAPGTFRIELNKTDGALGDLEERYGFRIVAQEHKKPLLVFTLTHPNSSRETHYRLFDDSFWPPKE